jgi:hypothetical protein
VIRIDFLLKEFCESADLAGRKDGTLQFVILLQQQGGHDFN